jgi:predicted nucleotidyltransferase
LAAPGSRRPAHEIMADMDRAQTGSYEGPLARVVERLRGIPGVAGLVLGGSRARGHGGPEADIDIGIYYRERSRPEVSLVRAAAQALDDRGRPDGFARYGEWGPWINGGAWLVVDGHKTDLLFRELERVERVLAECETGVVLPVYQPGHPHCFVNHIYAGEIYYNAILFDPDRAMARLRRRVDPYPEALAGALMRTFGWEAEFSLQIAGAAARRCDVAYVAGCLYRSVACMTQALFAANRVYLVNEKGALAAVESLAQHPEDFAARATGVLGRVGDTAQQLGAALAETHELQRETRAVLERCGAPRSAA